MNLSSNDFELFGIVRRFALDRARLDACWRALQAQVHPDKFAADGPAAQRLAMQWAVRVNEAYQRLKDPLRRAALLCELAGVSIDAEKNTAMPSDFLVQQMQWRDDLDEADKASAVHVLANQVASYRAQAIDALRVALDERNDPHSAAAQVRALMFVERFAADVDSRLEMLEH